MHNKKGKWFFRIIKSILRIFIKQPKYLHLEELEEGSLFLSNHVGSSVPVNTELYFPHYFRIWGSFENASSSKERYNYLKDVYFLKKKHNPKFIATIKAFFACEFLGMFYKGMNIIKTYPDARMVKTIKESIVHLNENKSLIIFPEDSSEGYFDELKTYKSGFMTMLNSFHKKNPKNIKIYNMYYRKKDNTFIIDRPVYLNTLLEANLSNDQIAEVFKTRANILSTINTKEELEQLEILFK